MLKRRKRLAPTDPGHHASWLRRRVRRHGRDDGLLVVHGANVVQKPGKFDRKFCARYAKLPRMDTGHTTEVGWRRKGAEVRLPEVHRTVVIPAGASFWRKMLAFAGPGFLVAVGYMDPGNWVTDLAGGAQFGYTLLCVIMVSNLMAILLQHLCVKLGIATGHDLAQACRDHYSTPTVWFLWILCEIAIAACDLAEVVGSAIALQLLFGIPLVCGCCITPLDEL